MSTPRGGTRGAVAVPHVYFDGFDGFGCGQPILTGPPPAPACYPVRSSNLMSRQRCSPPRPVTHYLVCLDANGISIELTRR
jgi:hypothetical protein